MKKSSLISSMVSLCMTSLLLISCVVAWYCVNITSNVSGVVGSSKEDKNFDYELYYYDGDSWELIDEKLSSFIPLKPGEKVYFKLMIDSKSNEGSTLKCKFENINTTVASEILYSEYTQVTSSNYNKFDSDLEYYTLNNDVYTLSYVAPFTTDGLLSTKSGNVYTPVTSGEYNSNIDYYFTDDTYGLGYTNNVANIFTTNGSIYVKSESFFYEQDGQIYHLFDSDAADCPWVYNSGTGAIVASDSISDVIMYSNVAYGTTEYEYAQIVNSHMEYSATSITQEDFTTDGSLYTYTDGNYSPVTSGSFDGDTTYYTVVSRAINSSDLFNNQVVTNGKETYYLFFTLEYLDLADNNPYIFQNLSVTRLAIEH